MPTPSSGQISLSDIRSQFALGGGVASGVSGNISAYYKADVAVPSSGEIKFSDFYNKNIHASKQASVDAVEGDSGLNRPFLLVTSQGANENHPGNFSTSINTWGSLTAAQQDAEDPSAAARNTTRNTILVWYVGTLNSFSGIYPTGSIDGTAFSWSDVRTANLATSVSKGTKTYSKIVLYSPNTDVKWKDYTSSATGLSIPCSDGGGVVETAWYRATWLLPNKWSVYSQTTSAQTATVSTVDILVPAGGLLVTNHGNGPNMTQTVNMSTCTTKNLNGSAGPTVTAVFEQRGITWYKGIGAALFKNNTASDLIFVVPVKAGSVQNALNAVVLQFVGDGYLNSV